MKRLNILEPTKEGSTGSALGAAMIEAAIKFHKGDPTEWNAFTLIQAASQIMRFAVETSLPPDRWDAALKWIGEDMRALSEINAMKAEVKMEIPPEKVN